MSTPSGFSVRSLLVHLTANFNLLLGGLAIAFGLYVLLAGADAMATMMQAGDAGAQAVGNVAPAENAKQIGDVTQLASEGIGAVFLAMASIVAGCAIAQGLPSVFVGLGILGRQRWARVFGILFGLFGLLQGLACFGGPGSTRSVYISGAVLTAYGLLSLITLIGGGAYFAHREPDPSKSGEPAPANSAALAGILASTLIVALACGLAYLNLPGGPGRSNGGNTDKQTEKLLAIWYNAGPDAHRLAFAKNGVLYFGTDKGASKGTYKLATADTLDLEYELPEAIYQAQKAAFDLAKKAADNPDNPLKGVVGAIEPVRVIKDRVRFTLADGDKTLTLHGAKKPVQYHLRERLPDDKKIEELFAFEPKVEPKNEGSELYCKRMAEVHDAIAKGQVSRLKEIAKDGAGFNDRDEKGETPLMNAVQAGYVNIVKELMKMGADWTVTDREGNDLFFYAISIGRLEWLASGLQLRSVGVNDLEGSTSKLSWPGHMSEGRNLKKQNGFIVAAAHGQIHDLKFMFTFLPNPDYSNKTGLAHHDNDGLTALDHAQAKGHKEVVAWIKSVTWTASTKPEEIGFLNACRAGGLNDVNAALKAANDDQRKELLQARDATGRTPLMIASERGHYYVVRALLDSFGEDTAKKQANLDIRDANHQSVLYYAASGDVKALLEQHGAK